MPTPTEKPPKSVPETITTIEITKSKDMSEFTRPKMTQKSQSEGLKGSIVALNDTFEENKISPSSSKPSNDIPECPKMVKSGDNITLNCCQNSESMTHMNLSAYIMELLKGDFLTE